MPAAARPTERRLFGVSAPGRTHQKRAVRRTSKVGPWESVGFGNPSCILSDDDHCTRALLPLRGCGRASCRDGGPFGDFCRDRRERRLGRLAGAVRSSLGGSRTSGESRLPGSPDGWCSSDSGPLFFGSETRDSTEGGDGAGLPAADPGPSGSDGGHLVRLERLWRCVKCRIPNGKRRGLRRHAEEKRREGIAG